MEHVFIKDPVHNYIKIEEPLLIDIINSREFQRLKRIKQLGCSHFTYPCAVHTRFSHSLGSMHLMSLVMSHLHSFVRESREKDDLEQEAMLAKLAALLHDIGHGPLSHTLEKIFGDHHTWTRRIVTENTIIANKLREQDSNLPKLVTEVLDGIYINSKGRKSYLPSLIASQLDVDRLDFLVRDSYFTGNKSGIIDIQRLIHTFRFHNGNIVLEEKSKHTVEEYILARYYMYWNVYFHKTTRGIEFILKSIINRAKELSHQNKLDFISDSLKPFFEKDRDKRKITIDEFICIDDIDILFCIKQWLHSKDKILSDLCERYLFRRHFVRVKEVSTPIDPQKIKQAMNYLDEQDKPSEYYFGWDSSSDLPYDYYTLEFGKKPINLLIGNKCEEISSRSEILRYLATRKVTTNIYVPEEYCDKIKNILRD